MADSSHPEVSTFVEQASASSEQRPPTEAVTAASREPVAPRWPGWNDPAAWVWLAMWRDCHRGRRIDVEAYLARLPEAERTDDMLLYLVCSEIAIRDILGDRPQLDEYQARFSRFAEALGQYFALLERSRTAEEENPDTVHTGAPGTGETHHPPAAPTVVPPPDSAPPEPALEPAPSLGATPVNGAAEFGVTLTQLPEHRPGAAPPVAPAPTGAPKAGPGPAVTVPSARQSEPTRDAADLPAAQRQTCTVPSGPLAARPNDPGTVAQTPDIARRSADVSRSRAPVVVPGYEVVEQIGYGSSGVVYKARELNLNRLVALKVLIHPSPEHLRRFHQEANAVARLQHPNIVQIYQIGESDDPPFLSLELCERGSLAGDLDGTPWPPGRAAALVETLARAMQVAHEARIIHRDLKPGNILLQGDPPVPKVTDFGLAKQLAGDAEQTMTGAVMGTPPYMAPEQAAGETYRIGPCTDVYGLGAILYELLTGRPPFKGATTAETLDQVRTQEPVPPAQLNPKVPRDLETICLQCLQKERDKRYASAQALAEDLARFQNGQPIVARPTTSVERLVKWARRRPAAAALIAVSSVALFTLVAAALLLAQSRSQTLKLQNQTLELKLAQEREQQQLRDKQQERAERERLDDLRKQVQRLITLANLHLRKKEWEPAQRNLTQAQGVLESQPRARAEFADEIQRLSAQVQTELDREKNDRLRRQEQDGARKLYTQFQADRDSALLHFSMAVGDDQAHHLAEAARNARQALARFDVHDADTSTPRIPAGLDKADRDKARRACYELLLVLADTEATPAPPQKPDRAHAMRALAILGHAARLIPAGTRAFYLRRSRYLTLTGDRRGSNAAQLVADGFEPRLALDFYLVGEDWYKQGNLDEASDAFQHALFLEPDYFWARYLLAVCYVQQELWPQARDALTACLKDRPDFVWPYLLLGFVNMRLNDFAAAENAFAQAQQRTTHDPEADSAFYANRGLLRISEKRVEEGIADLRRAIAKRPRQHQNHLSLAIVYEQQRDWEQARREFDLAIDCAPAVVSLYRARGGFRERRGDLEGALADFREALRRGQIGPVPGDPEDRALDHVSCGRLLQRLKRYRAAVRAYDEAIRLAVDLPEAYLGRAVSLLQLKSGDPNKKTDQLYEAASRDFDEYLTRRPNVSADAYRGRAVARIALGRYVSASADYATAAELDGRRAAALMAGGVAAVGIPPLFALTDFAAGQVTERGRATMYVARGLILLAYQSPQEARPEFETALRIDPKSPEARLGHGLALAKLGLPEEAVAEAQRALGAGLTTGEQYFRASLVFAQAAAEVRLDKTYRDGLARQLLSRYREQAVSLLERTRDHMPLADFKELWRKRVEPEGVFQQFRDNLRFRRMAPYRRVPVPRNPQ